MLPVTLIVGCARQATGPEYATPPPAVDSNRKLAELESKLAEDERRLWAALGSDSEPSKLESVQQGSPANEDAEEGAHGYEAAEPASASAPAEGADAPKDAPAPGGDSPCDVACLAFASMSRAARRICAIAGEESASCDDARSRVATAHQRLARSGCGCAR